MSVGENPYQADFGDHDLYNALEIVANGSGAGQEAAKVILGAVNDIAQEKAQKADTNAKEREAAPLKPISNATPGPVPGTERIAKGSDDDANAYGADFSEDDSAWLAAEIMKGFKKHE
jgi:hypothetical protein